MGLGIITDTVLFYIDLQSRDDHEGTPFSITGQCRNVKVKTGIYVKIAFSEVKTGKYEEWHFLGVQNGEMCGKSGISPMSKRGNTWKEWFWFSVL